MLPPGAPSSPLIEGLENRRLCSVAPTGVGSVSATLSSGGTLTVNGTGARDSIFIVHESDGRVHVETPKKGGRMRTLFAFKARKVRAVNVEAGGGNDYVDLRDFHRPSRVDGGAGNDFILGTDEDDFIEGGSDNDEVHAFDGNDHVLGDAGRDILLGMNGDDRLDGGTDADHLYGGDDNDTLMSKDGRLNDHLSGGPGDDTATADENADTEDADDFETQSAFSLQDIEHIS